MLPALVVFLVVVLVGVLALVALDRLAGVTGHLGDQARRENDFLQQQQREIRRGRL